MGSYVGPDEQGACKFPNTFLSTDGFQKGTCIGLGSSPTPNCFTKTATELKNADGREYHKDAKMISCFKALWSGQANLRESYQAFHITKVVKCWNWHGNLQEKPVLPKSKKKKLGESK